MTSHAISERAVVMRVDLPEREAAETTETPLAPVRRLDLVDDVIVSLDVHLGSADLSIKELMALQAGSLVTLDRRIDDSVDVRLNERTVARAEIVAVGDQFGIRIVEIVEER
ncbi:TPA: FliM/FliN family flagellar motor switch protein [Burkholderia cenocepacia]|uniref:FliM/FliN family flagellar motor switch protein n=1 Tax=unclassified Burkholderia TaxID=2613784 RepID=UPI00158B729A|nr:MULTISPECIES: FliM/FliN family flagellar motor switch protein [unclassified Burkholderia]HEF5875107.1 FliM/FliN family flagellar motor switch protein [Burkholderia cenocepacia]